MADFRSFEKWPGMSIGKSPRKPFRRNDRPEIRRETKTALPETVPVRNDVARPAVTPGGQWMGGGSGPRRVSEEEEVVLVQVELLHAGKQDRAVAVFDQHALGRVHGMGLHVGEVLQQRVVEMDDVALA